MEPQRAARAGLPVWFRTWMQMFASSSAEGNVCVADAVKDGHDRLSFFCVRLFDCEATRPSLSGGTSRW